MRARIGRPQSAVLALGCGLTWLACAAPPTTVSRKAPDTRAAPTLDQTLDALMPSVTSLASAFREHHLVDGVAFVANEPVGAAKPRFASDGDNAIFTGLALGAAAYRYGVRRTPADLDAVRTLLQGIHELTHACGVPGVLARTTFPRNRAWDDFGYARDRQTAPDNQWRRRTARGQVYETEDRVYYTKATRDQLTGAVFGLAVTHAVIEHEEIRHRVAAIASALARRLRETAGSLIDHEGRTGTNAHQIDAPLRLAVEALERATRAEQDAKPTNAFFDATRLRTAYYNRWFMRTFVFNLHMLNAHTLLVLREHHRDEVGVRRWQNRLWSLVQDDENPHFAALHFAATGVPPSAKALANLRRRAEESYPGFFAWEKDPDDWWGSARKVRGPGIDVLLPYWMLRYYTSHPGTRAAPPPP